MASTAKKFLLFILKHGLPFGFVLSAVMLTSRLLYFLWKGNNAEISRSADLLPVYFLVAVVAGLVRGILLWIFRRKDFGY